MMMLYIEIKEIHLRVIRDRISYMHWKMGHTTFARCGPLARLLLTCSSCTTAIGALAAFADDERLTSLMLMSLCKV